MIAPRIDAQSMYAPLRSVLVKRPFQAAWNQKQLEKHWRALGYLNCPDEGLAAKQHAAFVRLLTAGGCEVHFATGNDDVGLDSLYVHDAAVIVNGGAILCNMTKPQRDREPEALVPVFASLGIPIVASITGTARLEAGDVLWIDPRTAAVGIGPRSNIQGVEQLLRILGPRGVHVMRVPLPPGVVHLLGLISLVDRDLAVVSRRLPEVIRDELLDRGATLVEAPAIEEEGLACNILALGPRQCVMLASCPITQTELEAHGATVYVYDGTEISVKGSGGPTCLTRPLFREIPENVG